MTHDFYRPAACHRMQGAVDQAGRPLVVVAHHRVYFDWSNLGFSRQAPKNPKSVAPSKCRTRFRMCASNTTRWPARCRRLWWRSVEHSFNGFAVECFIDELAAAAGKDPVEFRRGLAREAGELEGEETKTIQIRRVCVLCSNSPRKSQDGRKPLPKGKGRGIATYHSFGSYIAEVAEVTVNGNNFKIDRMVAAIDCGQIVNPESVRAQAESAIIYGLSAALKNEITIKNGAVEQTQLRRLRSDSNQRSSAHRSSSNRRAKTIPEGWVNRRCRPPRRPWRMQFSRHVGGALGSCRFSWRPKASGLRPADGRPQTKHPSPTRTTDH